MLRLDANVVFIVLFKTECDEAQSLKNKKRVIVQTIWVWTVEEHLFILSLCKDRGSVRRKFEHNVFAHSTEMIEDKAVVDNNNEASSGGTLIRVRSGPIKAMNEFH